MAGRPRTCTYLILFCLSLSSCGTTPTVEDWPADLSERAVERVKDDEEIIFQAPDRFSNYMLILTDQRVYYDNGDISYSEISSVEMDDPVLPYYITLTLFDESWIRLRPIRRTWAEMRNINRAYRVIKNKLRVAEQIREQLKKESAPATTTVQINMRVADEMRQRSLVRGTNRREEIDKRLGVVAVVLRNHAEDLSLERDCQERGTAGGVIGTGLWPIDVTIFVIGMADAINKDIRESKCEKRTDPQLETVGNALIESLSRVRQEGTIQDWVTRFINPALGSPAIELPASEDLDSIKGRVDTLIELEPILGIVQTTNHSSSYSNYSLNTYIDVRLIRMKDNYIIDKHHYRHVSENVCGGKKANCNFDDSLTQAFSYFGFQLSRDVLR